MIKVKTREDFLIVLTAFLPYMPVCAEIGVLYGDFSKEILRIVKPETLVLIDPFIINHKKYKSGITTAYSTEEDYNKLLSIFYHQIKHGKVIVDRRFSFEAVKGYADCVFDMVYIDSSHLYQDVKKDLNDWLPKIKKDSIIAGHDYIELNDFGVIEAVDEFIKEHNFEMIVFNEIGNDWALKRKA